MKQHQRLTMGQFRKVLIAIDNAHTVPHGLTKHYQ